MAITRRQFLRRSGLLAGGVAGYGVFGNPFVRRAMAKAGNRFVVVIFLDGGNDGLNTVTPIDDGSGSLRTDYETARTSIRLSSSNLLPVGSDPATGATLGLHPALGGLHQLAMMGKLAVIQGCGYPDYSLSHDQSRRVWQTGVRQSGYGTGWLGRYLVEAGCGPLDIPAATIGDRVAPELAQAATSVLAFHEVAAAGFPYDTEYPGDIAAKRTAFDALYAEARSSLQSEMLLLGNSGSATLTASESYPPLHDLYLADRSSWDAQYASLEGRVAEGLREVAKIVYGVQQGQAGIGARYFRLSEVGYDTHADQGGEEPNGRQSELHRKLADALAVFYADIADMGAANDLLVVIYSEFNRRIQQNTSGTDHGSQGPVFVIGGTVNGGVYGNHPNIAPSALDDEGNTPYSQAPADPWRSRDLRDVYGTILKQWLGLDEATILANVLPADAGGLDPDRYWVAGNHDFEMPFLPQGGA